MVELSRSLLFQLHVPFSMLIRKVSFAAVSTYCSKKFLGITHRSQCCFTVKLFMSVAAPAWDKEKGSQRLQTPSKLLGVAYIPSIAKESCFHINMHYAFSEKQA